MRGVETQDNPVKCRHLGDSDDAAREVGAELGNDKVSLESKEKLLSGKRE